MKKFREFSFLLLRYPHAYAWAGRGWGPEVAAVTPRAHMGLSENVVLAWEALVLFETRFNFW